MMTHVFLLSAVVSLAANNAALAWEPVDQPDLAQQLKDAPVLDPEALDAPARGVTSWTFQLVPNPDGKTYDALQWYFRAYIGRFLFDPKTGKGTPLGNGGPSIYALAALGNKLYWSGYPSGPVDEFDPDRPWTLLKGGAPGKAPPEITTAESNPRRMVKDLHGETRVKKMFSAAIGADKRLYLGGGGIRDYAGGSFAWFDPESGEYGGMWRPFSGYRIYWVTPALQGRYIVASTKTSADELNGNAVPESAKLFVWDTTSHSIVLEIIPIAQARKAGPLIEVAPGWLLGLTDDPDTEKGGVLYGIDVRTGAVLFTKKVQGRLPFRWSSGTAHWDYVKGPDGNIYTYLGNALVRVRAEDARVEVLGRLKRIGRMCFVGDDLYLAGAEPVRRLTDLTRAVPHSAMSPL